MHDLIVIGGGPAGTSAAITCARSGAHVLLLERGRFPRQKVCGEFVSAESLALLADLLAPQDKRLLTDAVRIPGARVFLDGRTIETPVHPPAASISRLTLDAALWNSAEQCGTESRQQTVVQSISGNGPFLVTNFDRRISKPCVDKCRRPLVESESHADQRTKCGREVARPQRTFR